MNNQSLKGFIEKVRETDQSQLSRSYYGKKIDKHTPEMIEHRLSMIKYLEEKLREAKQ